MIRFYGMSPERIHVIPAGVDARIFRPVQDLQSLKKWRLKTFGFDTPYIVYVGKPVERRNISALIRAFGLMKRKKKVPQKLLIVGSDLGGASPFRKVIATEGLTKDVVVLGYVKYQEMPLVYSSADLLVYPSSYEGFGLPVLEAMACGTPVIALNNTSFPEFAGGVAHLLENAEVPTLQQGIETVLSDPSLRQRMSEDGPKRAARYDWRIIARSYLDLMLPVINAAPD
jgi:glycosyltransferase involved in cell wall biosynthesis